MPDSQVTMKSAEETLIAEKLISKISFNEKALKVIISSYDSLDYSCTT
jgi:hypothetical protein